MPDFEVYLSDLSLDVGFNGLGPVERDTSNGGPAAGDGRPISIKGRAYAKGLGVHAYSSIEVILDGIYARFRSDIGIDDEVGHQGSVIFQVEADDVLIFTSKPMKGGMKAQEIDLDVSGCMRLRLIVAPWKKNGVDFDHADWADARLVMAAPVPGPTVVVQPTEIPDVIANPGMGWQSFYTTKADDPNNEGIPSQTTYTRSYWDNWQSAPDDFGFAAMDALLDAARSAGQRLMWRLMPFGHDVGGPSWLRDQGVPGSWFSFGGGPQQWAADADDPRVQEEHLRLLQELGRRYDGHPDLDAIDIGSVGLWGEWHTWNTDPPVPMPTAESARKYIDAYFDSFPNTPKLMAAEITDYLGYAVSQGSGWRGDALGDPYHMEELYPTHVSGANATDAWTTAPVAFEMWDDLRTWPDTVPAIVDYALRYHASYVNNKSQPIPPEARPEVDRLLRGLGYRFVLRRLEHPRSARPGRTITVAMDWENRGVAPTYRRDRLVVGLRDVQGQMVQTFDSDVVLRDWLPAVPQHVTLSPGLSLNLAPGPYTLVLGIVDWETRQPVVQLAIAGRDPDGWYPLSTIRVGSRES